MKPLDVFGCVLVLKFEPVVDELPPDEVVPLEIVPELPVEPVTAPPADGGRTIVAFEPLTVPPVGCIPGRRFGVR